jgi:hypothetical protein
MQWLFTAGMSREPMNPLPKYSNERYAELMMCLPAEWSLTADTFRDENNFWPMGLLRQLARYPFRNDTWLSAGHIVPNGKAFAAGTTMSAAILMRPQLLGAKHTVRVRERDIPLWAVFPIYESETRFAKRFGHDALIKRLSKHRITELLDAQRPSVVAALK